MGKRKILQVVPALNAGGVERTTIEMAEAITAAGWEAHVASEGGRLEGELEQAGGILHRLNMASKNPFTISANIGRLKRLCKTEGIELIHARSRAPAWSAYAAARDLNLPFVTTYHGVYNAKSGLKRRYNSVMALGTVVIANSRYVAEHVIAEHGTDPRRVVVIYRGVDLEAFDPDKMSDIEAAEQRQAWQIPAEAQVVLLPGRLTRWKGQEHAIDALAALPDDIHLVLLGDAQGRDDYVAGLENRAAALGVADRVHMPGHSHNMPAALAAADVVVSASIEPEAFGRVAAEAQAMGKPVIATAHGGALETVIPGKTGWHYPPGDAEALAACLKEVLILPRANAAQMARDAREHVSSKFTKTRLQSLTMQVYEQIFSARGLKT